MKILIISHNCFNNNNNMGKTLISLFSAFNENEICQLYISNEVPNTDICNNYYRISDIDIFKSYYKLKVNGNVINSDIKNTNQINITKKVFGKKKFYKFILRDLMWKPVKWFNNDLKMWLDKQNPTHIYVVPGENKFFYDFSIKIADYLKIPTISYICDDFYYLRDKKNILKRIYYIGLRKKIKKLIDKSSLVITICNQLNKRYLEEFNKKCITIMTGQSIENKKITSSNKNVLNFSYFGNLTLNRYKSLYDIGEAIDNLNKKRKDKIILNVYSNFDDNKAISKLKTLKCLKFNGYVNGQAYDDAKKKSDILIHIESFDDNYIERVKYSISTKIPECLLSGKLLLAYGPETVASISYLIENNCAYVITSKENICEEINTLISSKDRREEIIKRQLFIGNQNHISEKNSEKLKKIIENLK